MQCRQTQYINLYASESSFIAEHCAAPVAPPKILGRAGANRRRLYKYDYQCCRRYQSSCLMVDGVKTLSLSAACFPQLSTRAYSVHCFILGARSSFVNNFLKFSEYSLEFCTGLQQTSASVLGIVVSVWGDYVQMQILNC